MRRKEVVRCMANKQNLITPKELNARRTPEERRENAAKAGRASGVARRNKVNLRKTAQAILSGTYQVNGKEKTGEDLVMDGIVTLLQLPQAKNWGKAMDLLVLLTGAESSEMDVKRQKAELEKVQAEIEKLKQLIEPSNDNDQVMEFIKAMTNTEKNPEG